MTIHQFVDTCKPVVAREPFNPKARLSDAQVRALADIARGREVRSSTAVALRKAGLAVLTVQSGRLKSYSQFRGPRSRPTTSLDAALTPEGEACLTAVCVARMLCALSH